MLLSFFFPSDAKETHVSPADEACLSPHWGWVVHFGADASALPSRIVPLVFLPLGVFNVYEPPVTCAAFNPPRPLVEVSEFKTYPIPALCSCYKHHWRISFAGPPAVLRPVIPRPGELF